MKIFLYQSKISKKSPVKEFIKKIESRERAKVLACLRSIEELGFDCPRVAFRQIRKRLWEIKINSHSRSFRIFYVRIRFSILVLLHMYQKQSQKAPRNEMAIAEKRLLEVLQDEKNYS